MTEQNRYARRPFGQIKLVFSGLLLALSGLALGGCGIGDWAEKKASEKLKKDLEEKLAADEDDDKSDKSKAKGDKAKGDKAKVDGPTWTEQVTGEKVSLTRTKLDDGGLPGFTMLAPEGAKVAKSPGGSGAEVAELAYGFAVWVREDPTATMAHLKAGAAAWHKDGKIENEDANSFIIAAKAIDGGDAYYYKGIFKANGKTYLCETETSSAPGKKAHAEAVDKVCESLEAGGKPIGSGGAAGEEKVASAEPAKAEPEPSAKADAPVAANAAPAAQPSPAPKPQPQPQGQPAPPAKPQLTAPPATKPAAGPAPERKAAAKANCRCAKGDVMCNMRCSAR